MVAFEMQAFYRIENAAKALVILRLQKSDNVPREVRQRQIKRRALGVVRPLSTERIPVLHERWRRRQEHAHHVGLRDQRGVPREKTTIPARETQAVCPVAQRKSFQDNTSRAVSTGYWLRDELRSVGTRQAGGEGDAAGVSDSRRGVSAAAARRGVWMPARAPDGRLIDEAIADYRSEFEDALQYRSAVRMGASVIVTPDPSGFKEVDVAVL